jgi:enolase
MASNLNGITTIEDVIGREILDSRGNPTVEVEVLLMGAHTKRSSCATGINIAMAGRAFSKQ